MITHDNDVLVGTNFDGSKHKKGTGCFPYTTILGVELCMAFTVTFGAFSINMV
jgi:hypothetical protein